MYGEIHFSTLAREWVLRPPPRALWPAKEPLLSVARSESTNSAPVEWIHLMLTKRCHQLASSSWSCWRSTKLRLAGTDSGLCMIIEPVTIQQFSDAFFVVLLPAKVLRVLSPAAS